MDTTNPKFSGNTKSYSAQVRQRGQITIPRAIRDELKIDTGDSISFIKIGDAIVLSRTKPKVPEIVNRIMQKMENEDVTLADLLEGLEEERELLWRERQQKVGE